MRLKYNSSFKRERIEFLAEGGLEIEVPDGLGQELARRYARFEIVGKAKAESKAAAPAKAEPEPEEKPSPPAKSSAKKS